MLRKLYLSQNFADVGNAFSIVHDIYKSCEGKHIHCRLILEWENMYEPFDER